MGQHRTPGGFIVGRQPPTYQDSTPPASGYPPPAAHQPTPTPYGGMQQPPQQPSLTWAEAGIKDVSRGTPRGLILIIAILGIALIGFGAFHFGLLTGPVNAAKGLITGIHWPSSLPHQTNKDTTPPIIDNASVSDITSTSAIVTWDTNESATSQVMMCEPTGLCTWTELDKNLVIKHSVSLSSLKPNTAYHYTASSADASGNEATKEGNLTTLAVAETAPLLISGVTVSDIGETSATIQWETTLAVTGQVEYGKTDAYGLTTTSSQQPTTKHNVTLSGLEPNTIYYFRIRLKDTSGNDVLSEGDRSFTTSALPPGVQEGTEKGMRAPNFTLTTSDNKSVSLTDFRGKPVIVNFCGGGYRESRNELPLMQEAFDKWSGKGLVVIGVDYSETPTEVQKFVTEKGLTYTVVLDQTGKVAKQYNVTSIPTTFFLDSQGIIKEIIPRPIHSTAEIEAIIGPM
jgi:peroxiredoxin